MTKRTQETEPKTIEFSRQGKRVVEGRFDGGNMSSDAGVMLLSEVDRRLGLALQKDSRREEGQRRARGTQSSLDK